MRIIEVLLFFAFCCQDISRLTNFFSIEKWVEPPKAHDHLDDVQRSHRAQSFFSFLACDLPKFFEHAQNHGFSVFRFFGPCKSLLFKLSYKWHYINVSAIFAFFKMPNCSF